MKYRRKVKKGTGTGRVIGFPTLNFNIGNFGEDHSEGVYMCEVEIENNTYFGALYFGPRLSTGKKVLEMYVIGFKNMIYNQSVRFKVLNKIRNPKAFSDLENLKKQIEDDLKKYK